MVCMMKKYFAVAFAGLMLASPAFAQSGQAFHNPCHRGPVPHWSIINNQREQFVTFLTQIRPNMTPDMADMIAYELCADMSLVNDSQGLTGRLNMLLRKYGY